MKKDAKRHYAFYNVHTWYGLSPACGCSGDLHLYAEFDADVSCKKCQRLLNKRYKRIVAHNDKFTKS